MFDSKKLKEAFAPYRLLVLSITFLLSIIANLMALPDNIKIIIVLVLAAIFFMTAGAVLQVYRQDEFSAGRWGFNREENERRLLNQAIETAVRSKKRIEVDCMGIKGASVSNLLTDELKKDRKWGEIQIRYLLLKADSPGAKNRAIIEGSWTLNESIRAGLGYAICVKNEFEKKVKESTIKIKHFHFIPSFYIVRVNELMVVGLYVKEKGRLCPYLVLKSESNVYFSHFKNYFEAIFNSELAVDSTDEFNNCDKDEQIIKSV
jgi:hypothetical protein